MPLARPCLSCSKPTRNGSRCPTCEASKQRQRNASRPWYRGTWRRKAEKVIKSQPWCSRCGATEDLTVDHVSNRDPSVTDVLCRSCNSSKQ